MSTRGLIFIAGIIVGFFVGMLSFSSHGKVNSMVTVCILVIIKIQNII